MRDSDCGFLSNLRRIQIKRYRIRTGYGMCQIQMGSLCNVAIWGYNQFFTWAGGYDNSEIPPNNWHCFWYFFCGVRPITKWQIIVNRGILLTIRPLSSVIGVAYLIYIATWPN